MEAVKIMKNLFGFILAKKEEKVDNVRIILTVVLSSWWC